ncbi:MAG: hypothetical protein RLZ12_225 [Bacillota bacterium]
MNPNFCPPCNPVEIKPCCFPDKDRSKCGQAVEDTISGTFIVDDNTRELVVWEAVGMRQQTGGSIAILLTTGSLPIKVIVNDDYFFYVEKNRTISKTFDVLNKIVIAFTGPPGSSIVSSGDYCIITHYIIDLNLNCNLSCR